MNEKIKNLQAGKVMLIFIILAALLSGTAFTVLKYKSSIVNPGELSAKHPNDARLGGYVSHAEFQDDCGHCHAPLHCVTDTKCQDCHIEIARERADNVGLHSRLPGADNCQTCHVEHQGEDASITEFAYANIDHARLANFSLELHEFDYEHDPMNCYSCHTHDLNMADSLDCITCHAEEDHDLMVGHLELYGSDCVACHDGRDRYTDFDHADYFPLDGAHVDLACADCHVDRVYEGTPEDCAACHEDPEIHLGIFGSDCYRCHSTTAWQPAELKVHTFLIDHGVEAGEVTCETCHENTYTEYPCYSCHDAGEMEDFHEQEEIYAYENCIDCHPTGRAGEANQYMDVDE